MKTFGKIVGGIFIALLISVLTWASVYLAVPAVQDKTDKLFKWNDYAVEDTVDSTTETTETVANILPIISLELVA